MHILAPTPATKLPVELGSRTARIMAEASAIFLACLTPDQKLRVQFQVESEEQQNTVIPRTRPTISTRCGGDLRDDWGKDLLHRYYRQSH